VRRTEARSAEIERPDGVARSFQVSLNKVEPSKSVLARNLLAKDDARAALSMRWKNAGHRCRSSSNPPPLPAALKGWQGQLPVQTGDRSSGHPARASAWLQTPMPAKKWHWTLCQVVELCRQYTKV
jgi:hypothetical protein